jgi:hypothetical protein
MAADVSEIWLRSWGWAWRTALAATPRPTGLLRATAPIAIIAVTVDMNPPRDALAGAALVPCVKASARCGETASIAHRKTGRFPE